MAALLIVALPHALVMKAGTSATKASAVGGTRLRDGPGVKPMRSNMRKVSRWKTACRVFLLCAATAITSRAQTFTSLVNFNSADGALPVSSLVQGTDGNFYGTTQGGGVKGYGTIFRVTPAGALTTVYSFALTDGAVPEGGLVQATNGIFYGTTLQNGANGTPSGYGTIFKITAGGTLSTVHWFDSADGADPYGLIQAPNGSFYGTTLAGGTYGFGTVCGNAGCGTIFKMTPGGTLTTLHSFDGTDGFAPGELVQATNGVFYGTADGGGANCAPNGCGTVFKITPGGTLTTMYSFCAMANCSDGAEPSAGLIQAANGNFYGTTTSGGYPDAGTIFEIAPGGALTTVHTFEVTDGAYPQGGLTQATDGNFYGTTYTGGVNGHGTIFKMTPRGALTTLHSFDGSDGSGPQTTLVQGTDGNLYGTTSVGGANGYGTVFKLAVGLGPFVRTLPTSGEVGGAVKILGTDMTGATTVTFNGAIAAFTVVSPSEISTTVPANATTGKVHVTTPGGTLPSNLAFRVRQ